MPSSLIKDSFVTRITTRSIHRHHSRARKNGKIPYLSNVIIVCQIGNLEEVNCEDTHDDERLEEVVENEQRRQQMVCVVRSCESLLLRRGHSRFLAIATIYPLESSTQDPVHFYVGARA